MLLQLVGILFLIIFVIFVIGINIIGSVVRSIFGRSHRRTGQSRNSQPENATQPKRKKVFDEDEGEYVDYEEIKE